MAQLSAERDPVSEAYSRSRRSKRWQLPENFDVRGLATTLSLITCIAGMGAAVVIFGNQTSADNTSAVTSTSETGLTLRTRTEGTARAAFISTPGPKETPTAQISLKAPTPDTKFTPTPRLAAIQGATKTAIAVTATHRATYAPAKTLNGKP